MEQYLFNGYALHNRALLYYGKIRAKIFDMRCPDEGRVGVHGEALEEYRLDVNLYVFGA